MEDLAVLSIKPNEITTLSLSEAYQNSLTSLMDVEDKDSLVYLCRVLIQDEHDFGIVLPAELKQDKEIAFNLPEQLCIFNPAKTYILKAELVLEDQLLTPFISRCTIDLEGLTEPENAQDEQEDDSNSISTEQPLNDESEDVDDIDDVLSVVAPIPIAEQKKTKLEEIAKVLDEDFVKQALFKAPEKQKALISVKTPEPVNVVELSPEKLALKQRMKTLLKGMLD
jgi:hypothetical protein